MNLVEQAMGKQKTAFIRAHPSARCAKKANLSDSEAVIRQPCRRPLLPPPPVVPLSTIHSAFTSEATSLDHNNGQPPSQTPKLLRPRMPPLDNMYESISSRQSSMRQQQQHIYEVIDSKPKVPPRTAASMTVAPKVARRVQPPANISDSTPHVLQPIVLKYFQQKLYESFGNDPQPQRALLEAVCGNNGGGGVEKHAANQHQISLMWETAQFLATAAYSQMAAQKVASSSNGGSRRVDKNAGGFCGALQRAPPPVPPALARRLANRENLGFGKVKVMLRVSDSPPEDPNVPNYLAIDKKKRQVTLSDPTSNVMAANGAQERGPMVSAPKIFAFDSLFTADDAQVDVCTSGLSEVIPAVLEGSDGCLLSLGYPGAGQTRTMMGSVNTSGDLGAIPCAIAWLYKGINEKRQKTRARFSVRVSALGVNATKPGTSARDLLAAHATESDESPGVYLRDDFLGGPTELLAPTAERAALFLDAALVGRGQGPYDPALIFTLHVYQYSLPRNGGVDGGRSRLHLIDLGGCSNRSGGLPLSAIGNTLLSILSGQRHPPNRDHPLTPLLKDCLAPLTCHVAIIAHIAHSQAHSDALTTIQLASRIHRMRRRKHKFPMSADKSLGLNSTGHQSGSSEGPDPSSSDLSADTVIYVGPCEETDGEHPPVYLPSLSSGDNRCAMNKALRGSGLESKPSPKKTVSKPPSIQPLNSPKRQIPKAKPSSDSPQASPRKYPSAVSKASNIPTPKGSPMKTPLLPQEQWIDGPRISRSKVAEARHLLREINHVKQNETWIDGPSAQMVAMPAGYGFMDNHKKSMIRQWVENQSSQHFPQQSQVIMPRKEAEESDELVSPLVKGGIHFLNGPASSESCIRTGLKMDSVPLQVDGLSERSSEKREGTEEEDQDSGPSEVPPALPLMDPLGSREISHESLARICSRVMSRESLALTQPNAEMMDCGLQVTEDDILRTMGSEHPLSALSNCDMSVVSSFHHGDVFSECALGDAAKRQFDQLARLRELFTSQLEMAEVTPSFRLTDAKSIYSEPPYRYNTGPGSVCSEPAYRPPSPSRCRDCHQSLSRTPSQSSLPSLNGIVAIACMEQYASLRHPDGASDPNLQKIESRIDETLSKRIIENPLAELSEKLANQQPSPVLPKHQFPLLPITTTSPETYVDSEHDSTPRTSKHSEISRRAESGYHSVATVRDSDESSFSSGACGAVAIPKTSVSPHMPQKSPKKRQKQDKSLCHWLRNPFTCTNPETEGEVSDF